MHMGEEETYGMLRESDPLSHTRPFCEAHYANGVRERDMHMGEEEKYVAYI